MTNTVRASLFVGGEWVDITGDVYTDSPISIFRGRSSESSQSSPGSCALSLKNDSGDYSPRNPLGAYFGQLGRNTKLKLWDECETHLVGFDTPGGTDDAFWIPDSVATSITGDIDVRVELELREETGNPTGLQSLAAKWNSTSNQQGWAFTLDNIFTTQDTARLSFYWSSTGSSNTSLSSDSFPVSLFRRPGRRVTLRATLDVNNGAGGKTATFYYGDSLDGPWTQIGDPVVSAGTTSIFNNTAVTAVGSYDGGGAIPPAGNAIDGAYYGFQLRNGIGGTVVASADFSALTPGATSFVDAQGNTWTTDGGTVGLVTRSDIRFLGEVASFPPRWDPSATYHVVPIEAAGVLRRLGQGKPPAESGLRAFTLASAGLYNYWPLNGAEGTTYSLDIGGTDSLRSKFYAYLLGTLSGPVFKYGVELGTYLGTGIELSYTGNGYLRGDVGSNYHNVAVDWVFQATNLGDFYMIAYDYAGCNWTVNFDGGTAQVSFTDPNTGPAVFSPVTNVEELQDGLVHHARLELLQDGADTDWSLYIDGELLDSGTQTAYNLTGTSMVLFDYYVTGTQTPVKLGHVTVWADSSATWPTASAASEAAAGYAGETAAERLQRICDLSGTSLQIAGAPADTSLMGPQPQDELLAQLRDAESTDLGILVDMREDVALLYRSRASLYNQTPAVTLDYSAGHIAPPFEPVEDDQLTRNDITASRRDGGSARAVLESGRLSVQEPPDGVGRYADSTTVNVQTDGALPGVASWLLSQGTIDAARFPSVTVNLAAPDVAADAELVTALHSLDIGDLLVITGASSVGIYDDVALIVQGYSERIGPVEHTITFNCTPASPYAVGVYDSSKYDTDGSELNSSATSSATSLSVARSAGANCVWTTDGAAFPFDINVGGERITVTGITGATSPQTFTVTRAVNGVVKAHAAGTSVRLWTTPRYAL